MNEITITLAAVCQFAGAVQNVARQGLCSQDTLTLAINSIINTSPDNTLAVYGSDLANLKPGLTTLVHYLADTKQEKDTEITRYIVGLMALERRLNKNPQRLSELASRIEDVERQMAHFNGSNENVLANLAGIYSDIISPLGQPIQVAGEPSLLNQKVNQHKIRTLLLAGIRSVVLWRQVGGKRRQILFRRKHIVKTAKTLLEQI